MAPPAVVQSLPPPLNSSAEQPPLFDGTIKLYTCYTCPFAQRVWITRNYKVSPLPLVNFIFCIRFCFQSFGPFFLGQFSGVDIAYIPFVERFQIFLSEVWKYDITAGRPKLAAWIEEMNKIDAYKQTKTNPIELVEYYKKRFTAQQ
ncbi:hypothetical protein NL676_018297 [Syzygium grande]|nr:hypothetical protein NL676_018297 [Syzygium grande]